MRASFLLLAVFVAAATAEDEEYLPSLKGMQGLRLICDTPEKLDLVHRYEELPGFDFLSTRSISIDVLVTADQSRLFKNVLDKNNISYSVFVEDMEEKVKDEFIAQLMARKNGFLRNRFGSRSDLSFEHYPDYEEIEDYVKQLGHTHSDVVTVIDIGTSYEGRSLYVVKISSGGQGKPGILIDAGIHAREWIAPSTALYFIDQLATNKSNRYLLESVDYYIVPVLNPDGYQFTHSSIQNRLWRKTRSETPGSRCRGVDANRNFEYGWMIIGASSNPCAETYAGSKPFSEPETQRLRDFVFANNGTFKLYLTFHSYGQYLLYPWGYTNDVPANEQQLRFLAQSVAGVIQSVRGTRYTYGTSANHLYPAAGGSDDWAMGAAGINLSYTIELPDRGTYGFLLPPSEIKHVGHETFQALKYFTKYVELDSSAWVWPV